jgi:hypothetical protein
MNSRDFTTHKLTINQDKGEESLKYGEEFPEQFEEYNYEIETLSVDIHSLLLAYTEENTVLKKITYEELTNELNRMHEETVIIYKLEKSLWFMTGCKKYLHKKIGISTDEAFLRILKSLTLLLLKISLSVEETYKEFGSLENKHPELSKVEGFKRFSILQNRIINQINTDLYNYILSHFLKCLPKDKIKSMIDWTNSIKKNGESEAYNALEDYYEYDNLIDLAPESKFDNGKINQTAAAYIHFYLDQGKEGDGITANNSKEIAKTYGYTRNNSDISLLRAFNKAREVASRSFAGSRITDNSRYNHLISTLNFLKENNHKKSYDYAIADLKDRFFTKYFKEYTYRTTGIQELDSNLEPA